MWRLSSTNDDDQIIAAALSAILGKKIFSASSISEQSQLNVNKVSLFDQHLTSFVYGKVGLDDTISNQTLMTLHISILATKTTFLCVIECDASVNKLKQIIYDKVDIPCNKQNLIYCGQEIDEGHLLSEYDIQDSSVIYVVRLRSIDSDDLLVFDATSRDPFYDYDFTNVNDDGVQFTRGGMEYSRPCGWKRYAIDVFSKYENEIWLGSQNHLDEWPVSYHGTGHDAAKSIAQVGYDLTKCKRFMYGHGIYSTPDINVAKRFAKFFTTNSPEYLVILQNRVNPKTLIRLSDNKTTSGEYWISPTAADIRPYGICIMKNS